MRKMLITLFILTILFVLYGFYINPQELTVKEYAIKIENLPDGYSGLKIVHFSDVLFGGYQTIERLEETVNKINEIEADVIFFTGDLLNTQYELTNENKDKIKELLSSLDCSLYKYAIIGDNDKEIITQYKEIMSESNFKILDNESSLLFYKEINPIQIIGLTDVSELAKATTIEDGISPIYKILLTHYPDDIESVNTENIGLVLAGHSLGGFVRLPFVGPLIKRDGARTYIDAYYEINNTKLYVSNGIGTEKYLFRTFNTPAINIYRLQSNQN